MNLVGALRARASAVVLATLAAVGFGVVSFLSLPSGIYPDVEFARVVVVARAGDVPPEQMQTMATRPLEEAIATVPGLRRLRSRTVRGATELSAQFEPGTDMWQTLQLVETHIAAVRAELPEETEIQVERVTATALPIATFNLVGDVSQRVLREAATLVVRPALTRVAGIGSVEVTGGDIREFEVILRPSALAAAHLTPRGVADRLAAGDRVAAVGRAVDGHQVLTVLAASEPTTVAELAALPVGAGPNGPIALSMVADVVEGAEDRTTSAAGRDGDVVAVTVSRAPGASAPEVIRGARSVIDDLVGSSGLPRGVRIEVVYDQSVLITDAMAGVRDAILLGVGLSLVVLAVFLRDLRAGVAAAVAVPITLVCTFGAMRLLGQTLNLMSLGGLAVAIGLVVDDAIVIVEAIVRRVEDGDEVATAAERGTSDLLAAVVGTTLTSVIVFAPMALLGGVVGDFFGALVVTLSAAVVLSLVVSLAVVPLLAGRLLRAGRGAAPAGRSRDRLSVAYGRLLRRMVRHPILSLAGVLLLAGTGAVAAMAIGTGFLPAMDEGAMVVDFIAPPGTSLEETDRIARGLDRILATTPGVVTFTRRTGAEMGPATATQENTGDILVRLAPRDDREPIHDVMDRVRARAAREVPEAQIELVQVLQDILDDLSGNPGPIEVKIFGPDQAVLERLARAAADRIEALPALEDFSSGIEGEVPVLRADIDAAGAARLGVSPADVADDLDVALAGRVAGRVRVGDRSLGVRIRIPDSIRFDPDAIADLPLAYGDTVIPLRAVAALSRTVGPSVLVRENMRQMIMLTAAVRPGVDLGDATDEVADHLRGLPVPSGYRVEIGGQQESALQARRDLAGVFGLGVVLVLAVVMIQLRSLRLALVVLIGAPLALVGALVTLLVTGIPLNASSLMGCVLLAGLVVKNGILLFEHARAHVGTNDDFGEALVRAGERRVRPILMTTAATVVGLVPLALGFGAGAELQRPLAVATIGGLMLSTLVTLLALPALACAIRPDGRPRS